MVKDGSDSIGISNEDLASDNPFQIRPDGGTVHCMYHISMTPPCISHSPVLVIMLLFKPLSQPYVIAGIRAAIVEGPGMFYFGIIDVLQEWNWSKKLERFFKVRSHWSLSFLIILAVPSIQDGHVQLADT